MDLHPGGTKPPLAGVEVEEHPQRSALARLAGVAGSVTYAAAGAAYGAASKAVTLGPSLLSSGGAANTAQPPCTEQVLELGLGGVDFEHVPAGDTTFAPACGPTFLVAARHVQCHLFARLTCTRAGHP